MSAQSPGKTVALVVIIVVVAVLLAAVGVRQRGRKHFGPHIPKPHAALTLSDSMGRNADDSAAPFRHPSGM